MEADGYKRQGDDHPLELTHSASKEVEKQTKNVFLIHVLMGLMSHDIDSDEHVCMYVCL
jgi:hypothetical protein